MSCFRAIIRPGMIERIWFWSKQNETTVIIKCILDAQNGHILDMIYALDYGLFKITLMYQKAILHQI